MEASVRSDSIHLAVGFLARNLPRVEGIGPDVVRVLLEAEVLPFSGVLAIPSAAVDIAKLLPMANAILEMPLPSEPRLARETRLCRIRVYFRYLLAARRRLRTDRERALELSMKAGRWDDYLRLQYWSFLSGCHLYLLAVGGLRYSFLGKPNERAALALRRRSHCIVSIRSGAAAV